MIAPNAGEDVEQQELPHHTGGDAKWKPDKMDARLAVSYKTKHILPCGSVIMLLGIFPEVENGRPHKTCLWMFRAVLFIIAKS